MLPGCDAASWLVSLGALLPFVEKALGHANREVTAEHYARWVPGAEGVNPPGLGEGDVWPDVLARLDWKEDDRAPRHGRKTRVQVLLSHVSSAPIALKEVFQNERDDQEREEDQERGG